MKANFQNSLNSFYQAVEDLRSTNCLVLWDKFADFGRVISPNFSANIFDRVISERQGHARGDNVFALDVRSNEIGRVSFGNYFNDRIDEIFRDIKKPVYLVTWYRRDVHDQILSIMGEGKVLANNKSRRDLLEDKALLERHLADAGITSPDYLKTTNFESVKDLPSFNQLKDKFEGDFVIQGTSKGGDGTFIIKSENDFNDCIGKLHGRIRMRKFSSSQYSTVYMLTYPNSDGSCDIYIDIPSSKPVGVRDLSIPTTLGAGGNWGNFPSIDYAKCFQDLEKLGQYFYKTYGLIGAWNIEGFAINGEFIPNEVNARIGGGNEVSGVNQISMDMLPFSLHNLLIQAGNNTLLRPKLADYKAQLIMESQRERRVCKPFYIKIYTPSHVDQICKSRFSNGLYSLEGSEATLVDKNVGSPLFADIDRNHVLITGAPIVGSSILPGQLVMMIEGTTSNTEIFEGPNQISEAISKKLAAFKLK